MSLRAVGIAFVVTFGAVAARADSQPSPHEMHITSHARCGSGEVAHELAAELAIRSVQVLVNVPVESSEVLWRLVLVPRGGASCDIRATRGEESFRLRAVRWRSSVSIRKAAIRLAWVSELTPKEREELPEEELVVSPEPEEDEQDVKEETPGSDLEGETVGEDATAKPTWLPFVTASVDLTAMNEDPTALWGLDLGIVSKGKWSFLMRGLGTFTSVESRVVYDDGTTTERGTLRAYGASVGPQFRQPFGAFGLLAMTDVGFLLAKEKLPPIAVAAGRSAQSSTGALAEGLVGIDWAPKRFVIRLLGGYRFVGPLNNIGGREFSFSGPVARLSFGYRAKR